MPTRSGQNKAKQIEKLEEEILQLKARELHILQLLWIIVKRYGKKSKVVVLNSAMAQFDKACKLRFEDSNPMYAYEIEARDPEPTK